MKILSLVIIILAFSEISNITYSQNEMSDVQLLAIYHDKIKALNPQDSYEGVDNSQFDNDLKVIREIDEYKYNRRFAIIGKKGKYEMELDPQTGEVRGYYNNLIHKKIGKDSKLYKKGEQPKKDEKEIIKEAEKVVKIFNNGKISEGYRLDKAEFSTSARFNNELYYAGIWWVIWRRFIDDHEVWGDSLIVMINETYGFFSYGGPTPLNYHRPKKINITQEKAIEIAKQLGAELLSDKNFYFYNHLRGIKMGDYVKSEMIITSANLQGHKFIRKHDESPDVYLFWWIQVRSVPAVKEDSAPFLEFFIDVETGELRGFRFM